MLIVFAATGAAQMLGFHLGFLSEVHMRHYGSLPFVLLACCMGLSVVVTAVLGIAMALRFGGDKKVVWSLLVFGVVAPTVLLLTSHSMMKSSRPQRPVPRADASRTP